MAGLRSRLLEKLHDLATLAPPGWGPLRGETFFRLTETLGNLGGCLLLAFGAPAWVFAWVYFGNALGDTWTFVAYAIGLGPILAWLFMASFFGSQDIGHEGRELARLVRCIVLGLLAANLMKPESALWRGSMRPLEDVYFHGVMVGVGITLIAALYWHARAETWRRRAREDEQNDWP